MCAVEMALWGIIYSPSFMKIGAGFQPTLRFFLNNLSGYNIGITDGIYEVHH
jgi:hypothetical protein